MMSKNSYSYKRISIAIYMIKLSKFSKAIWTVNFS